MMSNPEYKTFIFCNPQLLKGKTIQFSIKIAMNILDQCHYKVLIWLFILFRNMAVANMHIQHLY